jgi:hypothetical protein
VLLTLNLNDTILQKENAFIFQQITCGKAALCYWRQQDWVEIRAIGEAGRDPAE